MSQRVAPVQNFFRQLYCGAGIRVDLLRSKHYFHAMKTRPHSKTVLCTGHVLSFACHLTQQAAHGHATSTWLNSTYVYRSIVDAVSSMKLDMMV